MKKFYAFFAAALMSVSVFAAKDVVPSDAVLQSYYEEGQLCVCIFVPDSMACSDVVFVGTYNRNATDDWITDLSTLAKFEAVEGYDGWYVVAVNDETPADFQDKGIQGKPVILDQSGEFNWQYQVGAATKIRGGVEIVSGQYAGEVDLIHYTKDAPNVFTIDALKGGNPCSAVYHNYTITVISDGCEGFAVPYLIGDMTSWAFQQMQVNVTKTQELGAPVYDYSFKCAEGMQYQVVSGLMGADGTIAAEPAWSDESYLQKFVDGLWIRIPGASGDNQLTGEEAEILIDVRADDLRWARCVVEPAELTVARVKLPTLNAPDSVEIIGGFDGWKGTTMELTDGWYVAQFEAKPSQFFKFRSKGSWNQELEIYNAETDEWAKVADNQLVFAQLWQGEEGNRTIELDFSDADNYRWTVAEQDIENITLTEKAQKVMIDGVMYIIRDNKMFNVQGTQVR